MNEETPEKNIQNIHNYIDQPNMYQDIKGTEEGEQLIKIMKQLIASKFVNALKIQLNNIVRTRETGTSSQQQPQQQQPQQQQQQQQQRTHAAATYVSPPRPILPQTIADTQQPTQKRTVEEIEGIEEREESPKSKAKAKSATTKPAADDPRTFNSTR